jgi:hypothetical protein
MADDEDAQKRGVVGFIYAMGKFNLDLALVRKVAKLRSALPVRYDSVHICYDNPKLLPIMSLGMIVMGARSRMRFRSHYGSHEECQYQLTSFGIPILSSIPVSGSRGTFNLENHYKFLKTHRQLEAARAIAEKEYEASIQKRKQAQTKSSTIHKSLDGAESSSFGIGMTSPRYQISPSTTGADEIDTSIPSSSWYGAAMSLNFMSLPSLPAPWRIGGAPFPGSVEHNLPQAPAFGIVSKGSCYTPSKQNCYGGPMSVDPQINDVLFGRGKPIQDRPGNVRFRDIMEWHRPQYDKGEKSEKTVIAADIVRIVKGEGGRFLKQNENGRGWVEVDDASARVKVSHAFRTRRSVVTAAAAAKKMSDR